MLSKHIYKELAKELNLPDYLVEKVAKHPIKCIVETMSEGEYKTINLKGFGKFVVKEGRLKYMQDLQRRLNEQTT